MRGVLVMREHGPWRGILVAIGIELVFALAIFLVLAATGSAASRRGREVMRFAPAQTVIVGRGLKPRKAARAHQKPPVATHAHKTTSQPPSTPSQPHVPRWRAGDNQSICMRGGDPGPWLRAHGDNAMRFIVDPDPTVDRVSPSEALPSGNQAGGPACVRTAEAEGYPVLLSVGLAKIWTPAEAAKRIREVTAAYGPVWAVAVGNEQDLDGSGHGGAMTAEQYASDWAAAEPALAQADPTAIRVYADASPRGGSWMQRAWGYGHQGAQVAAMNCYAVGYTIGMAQLPTFSAWASTQGVPMWCPESATPRANQRALLAKVERESPNLDMVADYFWPAYGAYAVRAESRRDER